MRGDGARGNILLVGTIVDGVKEQFSEMGGFLRDRRGNGGN